MALVRLFLVFEKTENSEHITLHSNFLKTKQRLQADSRRGAYRDKLYLMKSGEIKTDASLREFEIIHYW